MEVIVPFNKPYFTGKETSYIEEAVKSGKLSGNGAFTQRCHRFFEARYGFERCFLTNSCTDALEMAAILLNIGAGDEVIVPAFTFVSTANAFVLRGAKVVFVDSRPDHPGMDESKVEALITPRTKAIVAVHYAGVACDMDVLMDVAERHRLFVVEDAAQAIDGYYKERPLGGIGHLGAFSFHETKNIHCGEGGMLVVNDPQLIRKAEIVWEKGTNRVAFSRGEVDRYEWLDLGSSFLPSEISAAFLFAQLENIDQIQERRKEIWKVYHHLFLSFFEGEIPGPNADKAYPVGNNFLKGIMDPLPSKEEISAVGIPAYATHNAHMFYLVFKQPATRDRYIQQLKDQGVMAIFHYLPLHQSPYYKNNHKGGSLPLSVYYAEGLVRLPLFHDLAM